MDGWIDGVLPFEPLGASRVQAGVGQPPVVVLPGDDGIQQLSRRSIRTVVQHHLQQYVALSADAVVRAPSTQQRNFLRFPFPGRFRK
jgi:hypothetical protein